MKKQILLSLFVIVFVGVEAQVNLQNGSLGYSVPIYSYSDNSTKLGLNLSFSYSSGQGLKVDNIPSCVGEGWEISGIGSITRIQKGLPDDQYPQEGNWGDINNPKYPPGYLYNSRLIAEGCPNSLTTYPIFADANVGFLNFNEQGADRELDEFIYHFNGHTGTFVLDKQNMGEVVLINNSKIKITASFFVNGINNCRTTINKFTIIDEVGVSYEFTALDKNRLTRDVNSTTGFYFQGSFILSEEVPLIQKPYIVNSWALTKIIDLKSGKNIKIDYLENNILLEGKTEVQTSFNSDYNDQSTGNCSGGHCFTTVVGNQLGPKISVRKTLLSEVKPEISKITFPDDSYLNFTYGAERFDCPGSFKLNDITFTNQLGERGFKFQLIQKYFIKNVVDEANQQNKKWSRLCLTSITQFGKSDADQINPVSFEYYLGDNSTENFVPPLFFHPQDPWGYYNGDASGTPTGEFLGSNSTLTGAEFQSFYKLTTYNDVLNAEYAGPDGFGRINTNTKLNYAKNGLLKKVTNSYGGISQFEYEQNTVSFLHNKRDITSKTSILAPSGFNESVVGGVHLSKVIDNDGTNQVTTEYIYRDDLGNSTLWGIEQPKNMSQFTEFYQPVSQYVDPFCFCCKYRYKYLGILNYTKHSNPFKMNFLAKATIIGEGLIKESIKGQVLKAMGLKPFPSILNIKESILNIKKLTPLNSLVWQMEIYNTISNFVASCSYAGETHDMRQRTNFASNLDNTLPIVFASVTVKKYSTSVTNNGKSVFKFSTEDDYPLLIPENNYPFTSKPRYYPWKYGLLKSEKQFDINSNPIHEIINNYEPTANVSSTSINTQSCNCNVSYTSSKRIEDWTDPNFVNSFTNTDIPNKLKVEFYNVISGRMELKSTIEKTYKGSTNAITTNTDFFYNSLNYLPSSSKSSNSKSTLIENKTYYLEDYNLTAQPVLQQMKNDNVVNVPISSETWQTKSGGLPELISLSVSEFGLAPNGDYKTIKTYSLQTDKPIPQSTIGVFNPNQLIRNNTLIQPQTEFVYNGSGNLVQDKDLQGNRNTTTLYYYDHLLPVANVVNATFNEVAYTSFEKGWGSAIPDINCGYVTDSKWEASNNVVFSVDDVSAPTGKSCAQLNVGGAISLFGECNFTGITKDYKLTLWASSTSFSVNGNLIPYIKGPVINGWTYYEFNLPAGSPRPVITGTCKIDELRLYPKNASMATTTYDVGIGKTSECDINNRITYFEYDGLGRPTKVLDENRNIIKTYEYHFKN